jgi:hypothetical protein
MKRLQNMAAKGILPRHLATCPIPICQSCLFGHMSRHARRHKGKQEPDKLSKGLTFPGQCVSFDQIESPHPGIIAQMKGTPIRERHHVATVFVDNYSDFTFVYLQRTTNSWHRRNLNNIQDQFVSQLKNTIPTTVDSSNKSG